MIQGKMLYKEPEGALFLKKNAMLWLFILVPNVWFALWPIESGPVSAWVFFQVVKLFVNASEEYGEHHLSQNDAHIAESQEIWLGERRFENI